MVDIELFEGTEGNTTRIAKSIQLFTDQGSYIRRFCEVLNVPPESEEVKVNPILMFYGKGGHGKSRLLTELKEEYSYILPKEEWQKLSNGNHNDEEFKSAFQKVGTKGKSPDRTIELDFRNEGATVSSPWEKYLLQLCSELPDAPLPRFLFTYSLFRQTENKPLTAEEKKTYLSSKDYGFWLDLMGELTGGTASTLTKKALEKLAPKLDRLLRNLLLIRVAEPCMLMAIPFIKVLFPV